MRRLCSARIAKLGFSLLAIVFFLIACERKQASEPVSLLPTLSSIQANILTPKCVNRGCHPGGGAPMSLASGVARSNLVGINSGYGNLKRVQPLEASNSVLYLKVVGDPLVGGVQNRMPLGSAALNSDEINAIRDWINAGAQDN